MKGLEPAEFVLQVLQLATMTIGILGLIIISSTFEGLTTTYDEQRLSVDMLQGISAAPCLTVQVDGEARKGLLDADKLDAQAGSPAFCISVVARDWGATVESEGHSWGFHNITAQGTKSTTTVAVKFNDHVSPGVLMAVVDK
jgi:hypothetical protein